MGTPATLIDLLDRRFERDPGRTAYTFLPGKDKPDQVLTYEGLAARCGAIASLLSESTKPGDRVLLLYPPGLGFIEAFLGCIYAGRVAVPLGTVKPNRPGNHMDSIRRNCSPAAMLAQRSYHADLHRNAWIQESLRGLPALFNEDADASLSGLSPFAAASDTLAFLQYTSGSTREPRGVMVTHGNLMADMRLIRPSFGFDPETRMFGWLPFFHDMGLVGNLLQPLEQGNPSILMAPMQFLSQPIQWLRGVSTFRATISGAPNFAYDLCVDRTTEEERQGLDLSCWKVAFNGSEPVSARTMRRFAETFAPYGFRKEALYPCYGMAECTLFVSGKPHGTSDHHVLTTRRALAEGLPLEEADGEVELIACGSSWPGQTLVVVDPDNLVEIPAGRIGEIWIAGSHVSQGYWENPERNAESFGYLLAGRSEKFLRTGDMGFLDAEGRLYITGRRKELLIVRGKNHYPQDLEDTVQTRIPGLLLHGGAAFSQSGESEERIVLVQEIKRGIPESEHVSIASRIREEVLANHGIVIHEVVIVRQGAIPLTSSGKIQRLKCRDLLDQGKLHVLHRLSLQENAAIRSPEADRPSEVPAAPSKDSITDKLAELILKHGPRKDIQVDPEESLSHYGLDSVTSVAIIGELETWLGIEIEATAIWEFPSIRKLAMHLATSAGQRAREPFPRGGRAAPVAEDSQDVDPENFPSAETDSLAGTGDGAGRSDPADGPLRFSLLFFASEDSGSEKDRYNLLMEASRFADRNGFEAVWVPERHFHAFGGLYPSPSVLAAALARETRNLRLRSGSVVLPLNNPVRVAEEWAVVDNLSRGRVDLGFAQGWNANDFVLAPEAYAGRKENLFQGVETIRRLWRGEAISLTNGRGETVPIRIHPAPIQEELPIWITCSGEDERFVEAGKGGFNILTALLFQPMDELFRKIRLYREARGSAGHNPGSGRVTLMMHTYVHPDPAHVRRTVKAPFLKYLETSTSLWRQEWDALKELSESEREKALEVAFERYSRTTSLMGTPAFAAETCLRLRENGVDEVACLIDFGLPLAEVMPSLARVAALAGRKDAVWTPGMAEGRPAAPPAETGGEPIAVIGVAANVPGAETADLMWENLKRGIDSVGPMPPGRWPRNRLGDPSSTEASAAPRAGWLPRVDMFDAEFFRISPHEASLMDPQQRLFLETAWKCIQDAGYSGSDLQGKPVGVYVGAADSRYEANFRWNRIEPDPHMLAGNTVCTLPARLSYFLDLRGPCLAIDTACSSSLVAIHEACRALQAGECEVAVAGGVSLLLTPDLFLVASKAGMLSSVGQCRAFDASADGYVPGEGAGAVLLKPLSAALLDGDSIYGIIRGSALNHDGRTNGITAPNPKAQVEVAREALRRAGALPESIGYVECHGTGTHLGDPIEYRALKEIYGARAEALYIGSVKTNIGHLLAAAGVAGFIKALFSLKQRMFVPSIHFDQPNPNLDYGISPLRVMTGASPWEAEGPRRAAVSSYGHSGTNCTLILEEWVAEKAPSGPEPEVCVVSGRTEGELREYLELLSARLLQSKNPSIASIARTLALGRISYGCRAAFVAASAGELAASMRQALASEKPGGMAAFAAGERFLRAQSDPRSRAALAAALTYLEGKDPDWEQAISPAARAHLPPYPLHPKSHWVKPKGSDQPESAGLEPESGSRKEAHALPATISARAAIPGQMHPATAAAQAATETASLDHPEAVMQDLRSLMARLLGCEWEAVDPAVRFLDLGADSLLLMDALTHLQVTYCLKMSIGDFFETADTLAKLHGRVWSHLASGRSVRPVSLTLAENSGPAKVRREMPGATLPGWASVGSVPIEDIDTSFVDAYCTMTARSKQITQAGRKVLADNRASAGFRLPAKELVYPLVADCGQGAYLEDVDGNRFLDITMGFGVHLFGHNPPFIREALARAVERGFVLGPNSPLAGDVAGRIARLTGHSRVAFCNSGTEAVMSALRLARSYTGRSRVVLFSHSYHGHSDGVLAYADGDGSQPAVPGVPEGAVAATTVLPYGDPSCFRILEDLRGDLAAILVEPVQARNPGFQPFEFLEKLREWTRKRGVVLIFDEMITGFRIAKGGVQELLGFRADLTAYGKIVGGGMPIGVLAGEADILDGIDGGYWNYGDASAPSARTTFFAGTFSKHPLALEAASAALDRMESAGNEFYPRLNASSDDVRRRLNKTFRDENYPGEVKNFGSLFRFFLKGRQDLFFYRLVMNGVFVWEGRNCFLSTEHGPDEADRLVEAVRDAVRGIRVPAPLAQISHATGAGPGSAGFPSLDSQRQLWALAQIDPPRFSAYNECHALRMTGSVDIEALRAGSESIQRRHELLHCRLSGDGTRWLPFQDGEDPFCVEDVESVEVAETRMVQEKGRFFEVGSGLLWKLIFLRLPDGSGYLLANFHHLVIDGWSFSILLEEIAVVYNARRSGQDIAAPPVVPFSRFVEHKRTWLAGTAGQECADFWKQSLAGYLPGGPDGTHGSAVESGSISETLPAQVWKSLQSSARRLGATPAALLLSAYLPTLWERRRVDDVVVAVPVSARTFPGSTRIVGYCTHLMPMRFSAAASETVGELVADTQRILAAGLSHQDYPFSSILKDYRREGGSKPDLLASLGFNLDRNFKAPELIGNRWELVGSPAAASDFDANLTVMEHDGGASFTLQHRLDSIDGETAARWIKLFLSMLSSLGTAEPGTAWRDLAADAGIASDILERASESSFSFE